MTGGSYGSRMFGGTLEMVTGITQG